MKDLNLQGPPRKDRRTGTTIGPFRSAGYPLSTSWMKINGRPAVQYATPDLVWTQIVEHDDHGIKSYDVTFSKQPGETRTIYDLDEAMAFAEWLVS